MVVPTLQSLSLHAQRINASEIYSLPSIYFSRLQNAVAQSFVGFERPGLCVCMRISSCTRCGHGPRDLVIPCRARSMWVLRSLFPRYCAKSIIACRTRNGGFAVMVFKDLPPNLLSHAEREARGVCDHQVRFMHMVGKVGVGKSLLLQCRRSTGWTMLSKSQGLRNSLEYAIVKNLLCILCLK